MAEDLPRIEALLARIRALKGESLARLRVLCQREERLEWRLKSYCNPEGLGRGVYVRPHRRSVWERARAADREDDDE